MESQAPSKTQNPPKQPAREVDSGSYRYKLMNSLAGTYVLLSFFTLFLVIINGEPDPKPALSTSFVIGFTLLAHIIAFFMVAYFVVRMQEACRYSHPDDPFTWSQAAKDALLFAAGVGSTVAVIWTAIATGQDDNQLWHFPLAIAGMATAIPCFIAIARQNPEFHK